MTDHREITERPIRKAVWRGYWIDGTIEHGREHEHWCAVCGRRFIARSERAVVCGSDDCRRAHNRNQPHAVERRLGAREKSCEICGEPFPASRIDAKTCSPACRQRAYRRRVSSNPKNLRHQLERRSTGS